MKKNNKSKRSKLCCFIGGVAFTGGMLILMPKIIELGSNYFYNVKPKTKIENNDDWGPEIVKTNILHGN